MDAWPRGGTLPSHLLPVSIGPQVTPGTVYAMKYLNFGPLAGALAQLRYDANSYKRQLRHHLQCPRVFLPLVRFAAHFAVMRRTLTAVFHHSCGILR